MTGPGRHAAEVRHRTARSAPAPSTASSPIGGARSAILGLQRDAGNRATAELVGRLSRAPGPVLQRCGGHACPAGGCPTGEERVLARAAVRPGPAVAPPIVDRVLRSGGRPLDSPSRTAMEARFGHDFGRVRLHIGAEATSSAQAVGASAYTVGNHIVMGEGYAASSPSGQRTLAHELTHVIQQEGAAAGVQGSTPVGDAADPLEREAHTVADRVTSGGGTVMVAGRASGQAVHRQPREPALVPNAAGGCGICFGGDVRAVGITAHRQIQTEFETMYPLIHTEFVVAPPGSGYIINKGVPDLVMGTPTGVKVGEIKPANPEGYIEGDAKIEIYRRLLREKYGKTDPGWTVERMDLPPPAPSLFIEPASLSCTQQLYVNPPVRGVYGYFCLPPFSNELRRKCQCRKRDKKEEEQRYRQWQEAAKPQEQKQQRRVRAELVGADPAFAEYAGRMPLPRIRPGQQFVISFRDDLYTKAVDEFNRRQLRQQTRLMQVDPRGVPILVVGVALIPIAVAFGVIELFILGGMAAPAILAAAPEAAVGVAAEVGVGTTVAAEATTAAAPILTVIEGGAATTATAGTAATVGGAAATSSSAVVFTRAAAAALIPTLLAAGASRAEAAAAVEPLVDKRIVAVLEVSERGGVGAYKRGQQISINDGNTYRAAIALAAEGSR